MFTQRLQGISSIYRGQETILDVRNAAFSVDFHREVPLTSDLKRVGILMTTV